MLTPTSPELETLLKARRPVTDDETKRSVERTIADVRARGDEAVREAARVYDAPTLDRVVARTAEWEKAEVEPVLDRAIDLAAERILRFHDNQFGRLFAAWSAHEGRPMSLDWNVLIWRMGGDFGHDSVGQRVRPVLRAGIYAPGGRAIYPSSVLMNALPAVGAGVKEYVIATPPRPDGTLAPALGRAIRAVDEAGGWTKKVTAIKVGGAAAIAAMALGTETIPRCDVVVGPGNRWVNEAKRQLWGECGFDGYAGPSEVCVLTDKTSDPKLAAADLLTQIEHAPDNVGFLVGTDEAVLVKIEAELFRMIAASPRREILEESSRNGATILAKNEKEACDVVNRIAPEHLTIATRDPEKTMHRISHAGAILLGEHTPESAGDYVAGPSHTLPTSGAARWQSPVNVMTFLRFQSVMNLSPAGLAELIPAIDALATAEGFPGHAAGATLRRR